MRLLPGSAGQLGADVTKLGEDIDFLQGNMSVATFDAKLSAAVGEFGQKLTPLEARIKSMEGKIATSIKPLDDRIKNLEAVSGTGNEMHDRAVVSKTLLWLSIAHSVMHICQAHCSVCPSSESVTLLQPSHACMVWHGGRLRIAPRMYDVA